MVRIVVLGNAVLDHRVWVDEWPPAGGRTPASAWVEDLGGSGAVASAAIARMGGAACFIGRRGDDAAGERVAVFLQGHGVDAGYFTAEPSARTAASSIVVAPGGDRFIFAYPGEGLRDDPGWVPLQALDATDAVLVDTRFPLAGAALAAAARTRGIPVVMDFDVDAAEPWALARAATHAIADEDLARRAGGVERLLGRLHAAGVWGAVTLGAGGVVHRHGRIPAFKVQAHDTTGAGDVFHGAFALGLAEGQDPETALTFASAAAAVRCATGNIPDRRAVDRLRGAAPPRDA
jgi:sulfofructose kinase